MKLTRKSSGLNRPEYDDNGGYYFPVEDGQITNPTSPHRYNNPTHIIILYPYKYKFYGMLGLW